MPERHHTHHRAIPRLTGPQASLLLRVVHAVRSQLDGDAARTRHLTRALASAAGVPAQAAPWRTGMPLPDADVMQAVQTGIAEHRTLLISHLQQDGEVRRLRLDPYRVRLESGFWYVIGRLSDGGVERVLRLDRVLSAEPDESFDPKPIDIDRYLGGVFVPEDPGTVAWVRFGRRSAAYAQERWGMGHTLPDGGAEIRIPYLREHFLIRTLAEFGADFEVLEPPELRVGVRDRALATLEQWRKEEGA